MPELRSIYMDHAAGRPIDSRVLEAMRPYLGESYGNPSSLNALGQTAREALETARARVARLINAERKECIIFTSGATESNNLAIKGITSRNRDRGTQIVTSSVEHMSTLNPCKYLATKGFELTFIPVDKYGVIDLAALDRQTSEKTALVTIVYANSEIGTIEPIKQASELVHGKGATLHVDATAAAGKIPIDVRAEGIDVMTISSNDIYGPKGVGALYIKDGVRIEPQVQGGGQERGLRSGTENVAGTVGFGEAAEIASKEMASESERLTRLRNHFIKGLLEPLPYAFLNGHPTERLSDNVSVRYSFIEGESILLSLGMKGVSASSGSACTAKTLEPSHVLLATGLKHEEAHGSVMFTLGRQNTQEQVDYVVSLMPDIVKRLRQMSPFTPKELQE